MSKRLGEKYSDFSKALSRLEEVLDIEPFDDYIYDAAIQRFEFTYELAWKLLKAFLFFQGIVEANTPRETFKEAFSAGIIIEGSTWIKMLEDRNLTSHTYDEEISKVVYYRIKNNYLSLFKDLKEYLEKEIKL